MSLELIGGLVTLFAIAAIGAPVAFAIIVGVVVYLRHRWPGYCHSW